MAVIEAEIMKLMDYETFIRIISDIPSCIFFKDTELKYRFTTHYWAQVSDESIIGKTDLEVRKDQENVGKAQEEDRAILRTKKAANIKSLVRSTERRATLN